MRILVHPRFNKKFRKLETALQDKAEERESIFIVDPFDTRLETHKLHGKEKQYWAYSINNKYRIKFSFLENGDVLYLDIGTHDEVY
ncbi:MAG TPA: type II toxin-antitoxin system mRNA interferase toxin, RelE/StbE family [Candidatus Paceibacterota bacterium]